jgi:hypothetical protein
MGISIAQFFYLLQQPRQHMFEIYLHGLLEETEDTRVLNQDSRIGVRRDAAV